MPYGLRFLTKSLALGTSLDFFVPDEDMPLAPNERGHDLYEDVIVTPTGNTFLYEKGKTKFWSLVFEDVSENTKNHIEHIVHGWFGSRQVTIVAFGTSVLGTSGSYPSFGSLASVGEVWGTGYCRFSARPRETAFDLWAFTVDIKEFGSEQSFS